MLLYFAQFLKNLPTKISSKLNRGRLSKHLRLPLLYSAIGNDIAYVKSPRGKEYKLLKEYKASLLLSKV